MNEAAQGPVLKELTVQGREEGCEQEGTPPHPATQVLSYRQMYVYTHTCECVYAHTLTQCTDAYLNVCYSR